MIRANDRTEELALAEEEAKALHDRQDYMQQDDTIAEGQQLRLAVVESYEPDGFWGTLGVRIIRPDGNVEEEVITGWTAPHYHVGGTFPDIKLPLIELGATVLIADMQSFAADFWGESAARWVVINPCFFRYVDCEI